MVYNCTKSNNKDWLCWEGFMRKSYRFFLPKIFFKEDKVPLPYLYLDQEQLTELQDAYQEGEDTGLVDSYQAGEDALSSLIEHKAFCDENNIKFILNRLFIYHDSDNEVSNQ